jgi:hypothetical protein
MPYKLVADGPAACHKEYSVYHFEHALMPSLDISDYTMVARLRGKIPLLSVLFPVIVTPREGDKVFWLFKPELIPDAFLPDSIRI